MNSQQEDSKQDMCSEHTSQHANMDWGHLTRLHPLDEELQEINGFSERENLSSLLMNFLVGCPTPSVQP